MKALKRRIARLLESDPFEDSLFQILQLPPRQAINPLISLLYSLRETTRWRAVAAIGSLVDAQAETDLDWARVVMRRLMWSLNDESGGIGWGCAEAMGEICAKSERLAGEFAKILVSYLTPGQNFIENEALQRGTLWAVGRIAQVQPERIRASAPTLIPFLEASDPVLRGLAAWTASALRDPRLEPYLLRLADDTTPVTLFYNGQLKEMGIQDLAFPHFKP